MERMSMYVQLDSLFEKLADEAYESYLKSDRKDETLKALVKKLTDVRSQTLELAKKEVNRLTTMYPGAI